MPITRRFPSLPRFIVAAATALLVLVVGATFAGAQSSQPVEQGSLSVDDGDLVLVQNQTVEVSGGGYAPGAEVEVVIESDPVHLATTHASGSGEIVEDVTIPATITPGEHTLKATGADAAGGLRVLTAEVEVVADPGVDTDGDGDVDDDDGDTGGITDGGSLARTGSNLTGLAVIGVAAVAAGAGLLALRRRLVAR
jgi:LPXTG-motif cell wall-anchored protein